MPGMPPHMLRKLPNYPGNDQIPSMEMFMQQNSIGMQQFGLMGMPMHMNMGMHMNPMHNIDPEYLNDPAAKRDFYGDKLYTKISNNPNYADVSDLFSKIVGIFLDLEETVIERLITDDVYFDIQVRETIRLLADRNQ